MFPLASDSLGSQRMESVGWGKIRDSEEVAAPPGTEHNARREVRFALPLLFTFALLSPARPGAAVEEVEFSR